MKSCERDAGKEPVALDVQVRDLVTNVVCNWLKQDMVQLLPEGMQG